MAVFGFPKIGYLGLGGPFPSQSGRFAETVTKNGASQDTELDLLGSAGNGARPAVRTLGSSRARGQDDGS